MKTRPLLLTKKRLTRLLVGESQLVHAESGQILKFLGLVLEEEEELERLKGEDFPENLNINDIILDEIVFDTSNKEDPIIIPDEETVLPGATSTGTGEEKTKAEKKDEEMTEQSVNDQTDNAQTIESTEAQEPPVITQIEDVQTTAPLVKDKEKEEEKAEEKTVALGNKPHPDR